MQGNAERNSRKETVLNGINTKWKHSDYKGERINKHSLAASGDARMNDDWASMRLQAHKDRKRTYVVTLRHVLATIVVMGKH